MRSGHLKGVGFALTVAALVSCHDLTGPEAFAGTYVLVKDRLPAHLLTTNDGSWFAAADTIRLYADGQGTEDGLHFFVPAEGSEVLAMTTRARDAFSFRVVNGRLEVIYSCPPNANCVWPNMVALRTASGLHVMHPNTSRSSRDYVEVSGVP